jgi:hypothetical protein
MIAPLGFFMTASQVSDYTGAAARCSTICPRCSLAVLSPAPLGFRFRESMARSE